MQVKTNNKLFKGSGSKKLILDDATRMKDNERRMKEIREAKEARHAAEYSDGIRQLNEFNELKISSEYENYVIPGDMMLVRLFKQVIKALDDEGKTESGLYLKEDSFRTTSIVKVLKLGEGVAESKRKIFTLDCLATIADYLTQIEPNPEYALALSKYNERISTARGPEMPKDLPDLDSIPQYINGLYGWTKYVFLKDKLMVNKDDLITFLVPSSFIQSKLEL